MAVSHSRHSCVALGLHPYPTRDNLSPLSLVGRAWRAIQLSNPYTSFRRMNFPSHPS